MPKGQVKAHQVGTFINTIIQNKNSQMKTLYENWLELPAEDRIKFVIRNPRYAIIRKGVIFKRFPFLSQALKWKVKNDSELWGEYYDICDLWTGQTGFKPMLSAKPSQYVHTI